MLGHPLPLAVVVPVAQATDAAAVAGLATAAEGIDHLVVHRLVVEVQHPALQPLAQRPGAGQGTGEHTSRQAVAGAIGQVDGLGLAGEGHHAGHRSEDLFVEGAHAGTDAAQYGRGIEQPFVPAALLQPGAGSEAVGDDALYPLQLPGIDQRPQLGRGFQRVAQAQGGGAGGQAFGEGGGEALVHQDQPGGHADLPLVQKAAPGGAADGAVEIGVVEHDQRILATQFQGHLLQVAPGAFRHLASGLGRAGEGDHPHLGMGAERRAGLGTPGQHLQHAPRQADGLEQPGDEDAATHRRLVIRLEHHGIAAGQRRGHGAQGKDQREIERRDHPHHAMGQAPGIGQGPALAGQDHAMGLQQLTGDLLQDDPGFTQFQLSLGQDATGLPGDQGGQFGAIHLQVRGGGQEQPGLLPGGPGRPGRLRPGRLGAGLVDVGDAGQTGAVQGLAGGRFDDLQGAALGGDPVAIEDPLAPGGAVQERRG